MRLDRLLAIVIKLLNRSRMPAKELAEHFGVTVRTIYRDMDAINLAGIPIVSYPGNNGGLGIMEQYKLDHQVFTPENFRSLLTVLRGVNATLKDRELDNAIEKIQSLVPPDRSRQIKDQLEQTSIEILPWGQPKTQSEKLRQIHAAIARNRLVSFTYFNSRGETRQRVAEPMTLLFKAYTWYLFAYCRGKKDYRLFRLTRMKNIRVLNTGFIRRGVTYRDAFPEEKPSPKMIPVKLKFSPSLRYQVEDHYEHHQVKVRPNGDVVVQTALPEDEWTAAFLLSYGDQVEVLSPEWLRTALERKAEKILRLYKPDIGLSPGHARLSNKKPRRAKSC